MALPGAFKTNRKSIALWVFLFKSLTRHAWIMETSEVMCHNAIITLSASHLEKSAKVEFVDNLREMEFPLGAYLLVSFVWSLLGLRLQVAKSFVTVVHIRKNHVSALVRTRVQSQ